jgi:hypothetical protein
MSFPARSRAWWWGMIVAFLLGAVLSHVALIYQPYSFLIGDCPYYAETAISIILDHDLDLRNQLKGGLETHERQISMGARGEWYPKHPILMPLLSVPLLPLFGMNAFLVFNVAVLVALAVALFEIASLAARPVAAAAGTLATIFGSFLVLYDYNYSPDLFACLLLTLSILALFRERDATSGFLMGLAVFARTSNLFLMPLLLVYVVWRRRLRGAAAFVAAAAAPIVAQACLNAMMFGSPLVSPYSRIITLDSGRVVLHSHMSDFGNPLWAGITGQLFDPEKGLARTAPVLLLAVPGYYLWFRRSREKALLCFGLSEFLFLLFSRYLYWPTSHIGNRFLMPAVALSAPAVACVADLLIERVAAARSRRTPTAPIVEPHPSADS